MNLTCVIAAALTRCLHDERRLYVASPGRDGVSPSAARSMRALPWVAHTARLGDNLTCVSYTLLACVLTLGFTPLRLYGLAYGAGCYMILFIFLRWAIRPVTRDMNAQQPTSNAQRPSGVAIRSPHWALDVGCWMFRIS